MEICSKREMNNLVNDAQKNFPLEIRTKNTLVTWVWTFFTNFLRQKILYSLTYERTLADYKVDKEDTFHLVLPLKGSGIISDHHQFIY